MGKLVARVMGSMEALEKDLEARSPGEMPWIKYITEDGMKVRFLTEPDQWVGFTEYFNQSTRRFIPMEEGEIIPDSSSPTKRYLANVLDVNTDEVVPLKLPKSLASDLMETTKLTGSITDRDFDLIRLGTTMENTSYKNLPSAPMERNLDKYALIDLLKTLEEARAEALDEGVVVHDEDVDRSDDVDTDDESAPTPAGGGAVEGIPPLAELLQMERDDLAAIARDKAVAFDEEARKGALIDVLVNASEA